MKRRMISVLMLIAVISSLFLSPRMVKAAGSPFQSPDLDGDGIADTLESSNWYINNFGPYRTDTTLMDTDGDGLTDAEEKLFNTGPFDPRSPGIGVKYDQSFKTIEYFSATDSAYTQTVRAGDQYLMRNDFIIRRGTTFHLVGPSNATLTITGAGLTPLTGALDSVNGGFRITVPSNGTVGTYTMTLTQGTWTKSMQLYVLFELPTDVPASQISAFLYDDDPANKKDEVAVFFKNPEFRYTMTSCPDPNNPDAPCSAWEYHNASGFAQAFFTEQFKRSVLLTYVMPAINGQTNQRAAVQAIADLSDREFRVNYAYMANSFSSAIYRWNDGTGVTMNGGGCETTAGVFTAMLRSAGILARPFEVDYTKTGTHGEPDWLYYNPDQYDNSVMFWIEGGWKAERNYGGEEGKYYPWAGGTTGIFDLQNILGSGDWYYNDYYGDLLVTAGAGWDFQNGSNGGGMVNTQWVGYVPGTEYTALNRDYVWDSRAPLQIVQSPYIDIFNCQIWKGDNWTPSEWSGTSNPAGRNAVQTYILPTDIPNPAAPMENWPYNPQPTACSPSTSTAACNAFMAQWTATCGTLNNMVQSVDPPARNSIYIPLASGTQVLLNFGNVTGDSGVDLNNDGLFDQLVITVQITTDHPGTYAVGGLLASGDKTYWSIKNTVQLVQGTQSVKIAFEGLPIGEDQVNGPYQLKAAWLAMPGQNFTILVPAQMSAFKKFDYSTQAYKADAFARLSATIGDRFSHQGKDLNGNGLFDAIDISIPLNISVPGSFSVEGDLYDGQGDLVGHAVWNGEDSTAHLEFNVSQTPPPYVLENLTLLDAKGPLLDARYYQVYQITDMEGKVDQGNITLPDQGTGIQPSTVQPTSYSITPVDTNGNGKFDKLVVTTRVAVTNSVVPAGYKIEGVLEDEHQKLVAWSWSGDQVLQLDSSLPPAQLPQKLTLEFDGKMLYDQLPLDNSAHVLKLIALKIYSGNPTSATTEARVDLPNLTIPAYSRSQFEPSNASVNLFLDDMESGQAKWSTTGDLFSLTGSTWESWSHAWAASSTAPASAALTLSSPLNLTGYAGAAIKLTYASQMASANDFVDLEGSVDGGVTWTKVTSLGGTTSYWKTSVIDLSALGKPAALLLRFNAHAQSGLVFYLDDVFVNAWVGVDSASFATTPAQITAASPATFLASYTSTDMTLPVTYSWNFGDGTTPVTNSTNPSVNHTFASAGDYTVQLTVTNPYDSKVVSQPVHAANPGGEYSLTINSGTGGSVTKNPNQTYYSSGTSVTLTATANAGYTFSGWSGDLTGSTNPVTVVMNANKTINANFTQTQFTLTTNTVGSGSITKTPDQPTYPSGTSVTLAATPAAGWSFGSWSGACTGTGACVVTMDSNKSVTATFTQNQYTLTTSVTGQGSITKTPDQATYTFGQSVTLAPVPAAGWEFKSWSGSCTGSGACVLTISANQTVAAEFVRSAVTLTVTPPTNGAIAVDPAGPYFYGDVVTLTATPQTGYSFTGWTGDASGTATPLTLTLNGSKTVGAIFTKVPVTLTINQSVGGTISADPAESYFYGDVVTLTVTPAAGYTLTGWTGNLSGDINPTTLTLNGNKTVGATYAKIPVTLTINQAVGGTITADKDGPYYYGDEVTLTASPDTGYDFINWTGGASGAASSVMITLNSDTTVSAVFERSVVTLTINPSTGGFITAAPLPPYHYGDVVTLTATADSGYVFTGWTDDASGANPTTLMMNGSKTVGATFEATLNTLPVLDPIGDKAGMANNLLTFTATATDSDLPAQTLSYSLDAGFPAGASIDAATGVFNWTPTSVQTGAFDVTVRVTDSGTPAQSAFETITITVANWLENWDGYANGTTMNNINGWTGWHDDPSASAQVTDVQSLSAPQSIQISGTNDQVHTYAGATTGKWVYTAWQFVPTDAVGVPYFLLMNEYPESSNGSWSVQVKFDTVSNQLSNEMGGGGSATLIKGRWVKLAVVIDLDADTHAFYYDGQLFYQSSWTITPNGTGILNIGALDLFANGASPVYYDDLSLSRAMTLTRAVVGSGSITPTQSAYGDGEIAELTAVPAAGWKFDHWNGDLSGSASTASITMDADKSVTAVFVPITYTLTVDQPENGAITPPTAVYDFNTLVTLTATPATGYHLVEWTGACSGSGECAVVMDGNKTVSALFAPLAPTCYTLTLSHTDQGSDPLASPANSTGCEAGTYVAGETINFSGAVSAVGYKISGWTGTNNDASQETFNSLTMPAADHTALVNYTLTEYDVTITAGTGGTATKSPEQTTYHLGDKVTLLATANPGYTFSGWSGSYTGNTNPVEIAVSDNMVINASFTQDEYTLAVTANNGSVILDPNKPTYTYGEVVSLTAEPATGFEFTGWAGDLNSTDNPASITMDSSKIVTANFTLKVVILTINPSTGGTINPSPAGPYHFGDVVTLTATADSGYTFTGWTDDASGANPTTLMMNGSKTIGATFEATLNTLPVLDPIGDKAGMANNLLTFTATATDTDLPAQTLSYSLDSGFPDGASIDAATGVFNWTPTSVQTGAFDVTVRVTDNGTPVQSAFETITINVANWLENWDGYTNGTSMHNVNGWIGWHDDPSASAQVTNTQSLSAPQSIQISATNDQIHTYSGATTGKWVYTAWQFVPTDAVGVPYFLLMNEYPESSNGSWSVQVKFDTVSNQLSNEMFGGGSATLVKGRWVKLAVVIDLDADTQAFYYDGQLFYQSSWTTTPNGTGIRNIGALDLFASGSSPVYYDDLSLSRAMTLTRAVVGSGSITPTQSAYGDGEIAELTAVPAAGWKFDHWNGDLSGSASTASITMDADKSVTAVFVPITYTLTVDQPENGAITPPTAVYDFNTLVTLTATPVTGYHLVEWTGACSGSGECAVVIDGDKTVSVIFAPDEYTFDVNITGQGSVAKDPDQPTYLYGTVVNLTATPAAGWTFAGWGGACSDTGGCAVTMDGNKSVTATFTQEEYSLSVIIDPENSGSVTPDIAGPYHYSDVVALTATPAAGYEFDSWDPALTDNKVTISGNVIVTAHFKRINYTINATASPVEGGTILRSIAEPYYFGDSVTLTAVPSVDWTFSGWGGDCTGKGTCVLSIDGNKTVTASFTQNEYSLFINIVGSGTINQNPGGSYHLGDSVILTPIPADEIALPFKGWTGANASDLINNGDGTWTVVMNAAMSLTANFVVPCDTTSLVSAINLVNSQGGGNIYLAGGCTYPVTNTIDDPVYGLVGLPVITTDIRLESAGSRVTITYGSADTSYPLVIVTEAGSLTLKNVQVGGAYVAPQSQSLSMLSKGSAFADASVLDRKFTNVKIGKLITPLK